MSAKNQDEHAQGGRQPADDRRADGSIPCGREYWRMMELAAYVLDSVIPSIRRDSVWIAKHFAQGRTFEYSLTLPSPFLLRATRGLATFMPHGQQ